MESKCLICDQPIDYCQGGHQVANEILFEALDADDVWGTNRGLMFDIAYIIWVATGELMPEYSPGARQRPSGMEDANFENESTWCQWLAEEYDVETLRKAFFDLDIVDRRERAAGRNY